MFFDKKKWGVQNCVVQNKNKRTHCKVYATHVFNISNSRSHTIELKTHSATRKPHHESCVHKRTACSCREHNVKYDKTHSEIKKNAL